MSAPRFLPRAFTDDPSGFGRVMNIRWKQPELGVPSVSIRAAQLQHAYAFRIRERIKQRRMSTKDYAKSVGVSYDRLMKVLRGEAIMRLEDIAAGDQFLGEISEFDRHKAAATA